MSKIDYQKLREIAEKTKITGEAPVMPFDQRINALNDFMKHFSPDIALALLDEVKRLEDTNIDAMCRIAEVEAREIKPAKGEVLVVVSGFTGCGKSAIAGEIEIAMKAIGVPVKWTNGDAEKRMTGADWLTAIEMYKPTVRIVEVNVPCVAGICIKGDAGGEMMDVKEKVLQVMRSRAALQDKALGGEYPFRMATWNLRLAMEKEFPDEEWRSADLRKILMELAKDGTVSKDTHASRIGQAVWRLEVK